MSFYSYTKCLLYINIYFRELEEDSDEANTEDNDFINDEEEEIEEEEEEEDQTALSKKFSKSAKIETPLKGNKSSSAKASRADSPFPDLPEPMYVCFILLVIFTYLYLALSSLRRPLTLIKSALMTCLVNVDVVDLLVLKLGRTLSVPS